MNVLTADASKAGTENVALNDSTRALRKPRDIPNPGTDPRGALLLKTFQSLQHVQPADPSWSAEKYC